MLQKDEKTAAQKSNADDVLIKELKKMVKGLPIEVLGKMDLTRARCCKDGTYAIVRIDKGYPVPEK